MSLRACYGGTIAAPVIADIFQNILPYLGIRRESGTIDYSDEEAYSYEYVKNT
ncbi:MAG: hypothetical protein ACLUD2_14445 [Clostridium sp.]